MSANQTLTTVVALMLSFVAAQPIAAQTAAGQSTAPANSFSDLARVLKPGTTIRITDSSGRKATGGWEAALVASLGC